MTGEVPVITQVKLPANWSTHSSSLYKTEVWVKDPQGPGNLTGVYLTVHEKSGDKEVFSDSLYDDGAHLNPKDGDVLASDGVYSNRFQAIDVIKNSEQTEFIFRFLAFDQQNNISQKWENIVTFSPNSPPEILHIFAPDSLSYIDENIIFSITVYDIDGINDINQAYFESEDPQRGITLFEKGLYNDGDFENNGDLVAGDSIFSTRIMTNFLVGKKGSYNLIFHIEDISEEENLNEAKHPIYIENYESQFTGMNIPDTIQIPISPEDFNRETMWMEVSDPEGLADIDSVYFFSLKPDSTFANSGQPFVMVDNGLPYNPVNPLIETGDTVADDGRFTLSLLVYGGSIQGTYTFSFYIRDWAGNLTGPMKQNVELILER
jgi:hypothetical protein